jgi:UDP-N-acetylmuramyl pentapeptide phosphotransferase/UDP-N-acetylglucosamine-1-phosphate transferase
MMVFTQLITLGAVTAAMSCAMSVLLVYSQRWHGKLSHDHDLGGVQKFHTTAVPRVGGLAVVAGIVFAVTCARVFLPNIVEAGHVDKLVRLLLASMPAFLAGAAEDITKKVSVRTRLVATLCSALIASALLGATVTELDIWGVDSLLSIAPIAIAVTATVVAGGANAINIIDGFNGLSSGVAIVMLAALGALAIGVGDSFVAMLATFGVGAALGFLLVNYPRGRLFLGDGGAYFLGFWVAEMAVLLLVRHPSLNAWQMLAVCAYPVIEVMFSIYRRKFIRNVNPGAPDALHLHTLVYRRLVSRVVRYDVEKPWTRNAAVALFVVPTVAGAAVLSVVLASTSPAGIAMVLLQCVVYVTVYARLVRGKWPGRAGSPLIQNDDAKTRVW